jgi:hypothetical protein
MRKILLGIFLVNAIGASAQYKMQSTIEIPNYASTFNFKQEVGSTKSFTLDKYEFKKKQTRAAGKRYFSFPLDMDTFLINEGNNGIFSGVNLNTRAMWKDSLVNQLFSNGFFPVEVMGISQILDPYAKRWSSSAFLGEIAIGSNYTVDTFGLVCSYFRRASKPAVVDTLRFTFLKGDQMANLFYGPTSAIGTLYSDTVEVAGLRTTYASKAAFSHSTTNTNVIVKDIYLNAASENDTLSNGFNYFETPVNMAVTNDIVGVSVNFLSGDPNIISGDSLSKYNIFRFATFGEGTADAAGDLVAANMYRDENDYNMSGNTWTTLPFGLGDGTANRYYIPAIAYSNATSSEITPWQYHWFQWTLNTTDGVSVGVNNVNKNNNVTIVPNPANDRIAINSEILNNNNGTIQILNMHGQLIKTVNVNASNAATIIDVANLVKGIYCIKVTANGSLSTKIFLKN